MIGRQEANNFIDQIARLTIDGEEVDGRVFIQENGDAVDTLTGLIQFARDLQKEAAEEARELRLYVEAARASNFTEDGLCEVDEDAEVSQDPENPDQGAYVSAWLWIADEDLRNEDGNE